mmetsp:Transcript_17053/g.35968  ORF Transcript_17053/g.35968 Transcript_17053/m.35968 type:complete len:1196 (-) Transcript_17053:606-4193(-)
MDIHMADLFFRADRQLSAAEEERANKLRRTYRQWRQGDASGPHADVLDLNHAASVNEQRSTAKMKRVRTFGDHVSKLALITSSTSASHRDSPVPFVKDDPDTEPSMDAEPSMDTKTDDPPPTFPQFTQTSMLPPLVTGGGCPFRQGEVVDEVALRAAAPTVSTPPLAHLPQITPEPVEPGKQLAPAARADAAASPVKVTTPSQSASASQPEVQLTAAQIAAFQAAYAKALEEQKSHYQKMHKLSRANGASATAPQKAVPKSAGQAGPSMLQPASQTVMHAATQNRAPPPASCSSNRGHSAPQGSSAKGVKRGGVGSSVDRGGLPVSASSPMTEDAACHSVVASHSDTEAGAPDVATMDDDEDGVDGKVLATSCAHGPLVTHPAMSQVSGMLASVFPTSSESWLYVTVAGEFGSPWAMGITASGVACGRLHFKPRMQQWALVEVEADPWEQVAWETILPSMMRTWGAIAPPKSDTRWICFPYLTALPRSCMDLPRLLAERKYSLDILPDVPQPMPVNVILPEAVVQRDMKTIGAYPSSSRNNSRSNRKRPKQTPALPQQHQSPQIGPPSSRSNALQGSGVSTGNASSSSHPLNDDAGKRRRLSCEPSPNDSEMMPALDESRLASSPSVADLINSLGMNRSTPGRMTPSSSMTQLLSVLEAHAPGDSDGFFDRQSSLENSLARMPSVSSMTSLLGFLRNNLSSSELQELTRDQSLADLQTLATFAREASTQDLSDLQHRLEQQHEQHQQQLQQQQQKKSQQQDPHMHPSQLHMQQLPQHAHEQRHQQQQQQQHLNLHQQQTQQSQQHSHLQRQHQHQMQPRQPLHPEEQQSVQYEQHRHGHYSQQYQQQPHQLYQPPLSQQPPQQQYQPPPSQQSPQYQPPSSQQPQQYPPSQQPQYQPPHAQQQPPQQFQPPLSQQRRPQHGQHIQQASSYQSREAGPVSDQWSGSAQTALRHQPPMQESPEMQSSNAASTHLRAQSSSQSDSLARMLPPMHAAHSSEDPQHKAGGASRLSERHSSSHPSQHADHRDNELQQLMQSHHMHSMQHRYHQQVLPQQGLQGNTLVQERHGAGMAEVQGTLSRQSAQVAAPPSAPGMQHQMGIQSSVGRDGLPQCLPSHQVERNREYAGGVLPGSMEMKDRHPPSNQSATHPPAMKESSSVQSLVDLVRSSSASSLVELMHSYSATNLAGLAREDAVPEF